MFISFTIPSPNQAAFHRLPQESRQDSFESFLGNQLRMSKRCSTGSRGSLGGDCDARPHPILANGLYEHHVKAWLEYFRPEQVFVVPYEMLSRSPRATMEAIANELGVNFAPDRVVERNAHHQEEEVAGSASLRDATSYFRASNEEVYGLIGSQRLGVLPEAARAHAFLDLPAER